ncbi:MAG: VOC family protein [Rubrobacter sp.]
MITDLGHPAFAAFDVERTLAFYGMLGIEEAFRLHHDDGSLMLVYLHVAGDRFIEVFPGGPPPDPDRSQSFMHVCLLTDDRHKRGR